MTSTCDLGRDIPCTRAPLAEVSLLCDRSSERVRAARFEILHRVFHLLVGAFPTPAF